MKQAYTYNQLVRFYNRSRKKLQSLTIQGKNLRKQNILKRRIAQLFKTLTGLQKVFRTGIATAALSAGMILFQPKAAQAQIIFGPVVTNPFGLTDIGFFSTPIFADLDNDGDIDLMSGESAGNFQYFENTGTADEPLFAVVVINPFGLTDIGTSPTPSFADLDNDGDIDLMVGESTGNFKYFENIGTLVAPAFSTVLTNPFGLTSVGYWGNHPTFVDLDNDGDYDLINFSYNHFVYFQNTGTIASPAFASPLSSPYGLTTNFNYGAPTFADLDNDGDMDLLVGNAYTPFFSYFENFTACTEPLQPYFADLDHDEYGAGISLGITTCDSITIYFSLNNLDCNECFPTIHPDAAEICDGIDNNCDGIIDEGLTDCYPNVSPSIEWENTIGGSSSDALVAVQQTTDGGYILGGFSDSGVSGDKTETNLGSFDYWVVKVDSAGNIEWQNTIGGNSNDILNSIQQTTDRGYILGGSSLSGISDDKTESLIGGTYYGDFWIVKLDSVGSIEWQNTIGGSSDDILRSVQQTTDGSYILGGSSLSGISDDKTEASIGFEGYADYWVVKLFATGEIEWENTIGGSRGDDLSSVQQTTEGCLVLK